MVLESIKIETSSQNPNPYSIQGMKRQVERKNEQTYHFRRRTFVAEPTTATSEASVAAPSETSAAAAASETTAASRRSHDFGWNVELKSEE